MLYLVHHAEALDTDVDPQRPLSAAGRAHAVRLAAELAARGVRPDAIWHSGKLRARQTAEAFWRACNPLASLSAQRGLLPGDPPQWIADRLIAEDDEVLVAGHMPQLALLLRLLVSGDAHAPTPEFPAHAVIALERQDSGWREVWRIVP